MIRRKGRAAERPKRSGTERARQYRCGIPADFETRTTGGAVRLFGGLGLGERRLAPLAHLAEGGIAAEPLAGDAVHRVSSGRLERRRHGFGVSAEH